MTGKQRYREFLKSEFWKELSRRKRDLVGKCEECGSTTNLQSHHHEYPKDWYETTLEQLQVLCRECHRKAHGFVVVPFHLYSGRDYGFCRTIHWVDSLTLRIGGGGYKLSPRDRRYLRLVAERYPAKKHDGCMVFHVSNCIAFDLLLNP